MKHVMIYFLLTVFAFSCATDKKEEFNFTADKFGDKRILRYQVPGFEDLAIKEKQLLYYLYQAALSGREIIYDQNYKYNLTVKRTLEAIFKSYTGDRTTVDFSNFMVYMKQVWFSSGIHHHYSMDKFNPGFSEEYFKELVNNSEGSDFPLSEGQTIEELVAMLIPIIFDPGVDAKRVSLDPQKDLITNSANNYYEGVSQKEVETFYAGMIDKKNKQPISYGLNSKLIKQDGQIIEKVWKVGGMYTEAIEEIVFWLEKAVTVAENDKQKKALSTLIEYYKSGDLHTFDVYSIAWVEDTDSKIDVINGFIEVYGDAMGYRGAFESVVQFTDAETSKRIKAIGNEAQWFEDNSPIMDPHKKAEVKGIDARVINVVVEAGDASPSTPIGINLPNSNWIRASHGSKSVSLGNIKDAYNEAGKSSGVIEEFGYNQQEIELSKLHSTLASNLHTDMHEVIGHASGVINEGIGTPKETLKSYSNTLEEARADLVALYFVLDPKLVEIGVMPSLDVGKAEYNSYIRNGLMLQLRRVELGRDLEESHMRNRQLNALWAYEMGKKDNVIEKVVKDNKTYFVINDYPKLRELFGTLLREIQRIKSEGDYKAANVLVQTYGVKVDVDLHKEVIERYSKLDSSPYSGFINPKLIAVMQGDEIIDVKVEYPADFAKQMLEYAEDYSFLPHLN